VQTPEGIFSTLCSFSNQPVKPFVKYGTVYSTRWSSISEILSQTGYATIFVHGRDLDFDKMNRFLRLLRFGQIIDRRDFPPSVNSAVGPSWPGYDDEEVMKRANGEFRKQKGSFLGVIYTMNTHPPFVVPQTYPKLFPESDEQHLFLNSLSYSDWTLKVFFDLARHERYFKDTIFILLADHARTREEFEYSSQFHIPLLIYAPGFVQPGV
jgi:phosphoglycerol transferase MdoB-like AlkP superfamily enzyme